MSRHWQCRRTVAGSSMTSYWLGTSSSSKCRTHTHRLSKSQKSCRGSRSTAGWCRGSHRMSSPASSLNRVAACSQRMSSLNGSLTTRTRCHNFPARRAWRTLRCQLEVLAYFSSREVSSVRNQYSNSSFSFATLYRSRSSSFQVVCSKSRNCRPNSSLVRSLVTRRSPCLRSGGALRGPPPRFRPRPGPANPRVLRDRGPETPNAWRTSRVGAWPATDTCDVTMLVHCERSGNCFPCPGVASAVDRETGPPDWGGWGERYPHRGPWRTGESGSGWGERWGEREGRRGTARGPTGDSCRPPRGVPEPEPGSSGARVRPEEDGRR